MNHTSNPKPIQPGTPASEPVDENLVVWLENLRSVPERDPETAVQSQARFLAELESLDLPETGPSIFTLITNWLRSLVGSNRKKEAKDMNTPAGRFSLATLVVVALIGVFLFGGAGTTVYAAQGSLPGDTLYPVKMTIEQGQASLSSDAATRAELYLQFANRRLDEISLLIAGERFQDISSGTAEFEAYVAQATRELEAVSKSNPAAASVLASKITSALTRYAQVLSGMKDRVPDNVKPEVEHAIEIAHQNGAEGVQANEIEISGAIEALGNGTLTVAGRTITVTAQTEIKGSLKAGEVVKVHATVGSDGSLTAREIEPAVGDPNASEAGDDKGKDELEPGDDRGGNGAIESGDDRGGTGGTEMRHGGDDVNDGTSVDDHSGSSGGVDDRSGSNSGSSSSSSGSGSSDSGSSGGSSSGSGSNSGSGSGGSSGGHGGGDDGGGHN